MKKFFGKSKVKINGLEKVIKIRSFSMVVRNHAKQGIKLSQLLMQTVQSIQAKNQYPEWLLNILRNYSRVQQVLTGEISLMVAIRLSPNK